MLKSVALKQTSALIAAVFAAPMLLSPALAQTPETAPAGAAATTEPAAAPVVGTAAPVTGDVTAETVVATVNGEAITLGQMIALKQTMYQGAGDMPNTAMWDLMLDQMISQTAMSQVAGNAPTERDKVMLELNRRGYLANAALERIAANPSDEELRAAYDKQFPADATPKTEYNAAHILVATEDEAKAIEAELAKGADFAKLAGEKSTDSNAANGGDLGWFTPDMMVKPFADAVVALKKDGISPPVQSQFGWHVIKLKDSREQPRPEFDAVRDQLVNQIAREKIEAEIQKQTAAAKIEKTPGLNPELLADTSLLGE